MNEGIPPLTIKEYYEKHTEVMVSLNGLKQGMDGINARLDQINGRVTKSESRIDVTERSIVGLQNEMKNLADKMTHAIEDANNKSIERWELSQNGIKETNAVIEEMKSSNDNKTTRIEGSRTFLWRWAFVAIMAIVFTIIGSVLQRTGIVNLTPNTSITNNK